MVDDPLGLAPREQVVDERMVVAQLLEPPGPRVGHLDADPSQQCLHVGRIAQVEALLDRDVAEHPLVAFGGERQRLGGVRPAAAR